MGSEMCIRDSSITAPEFLLPQQSETEFLMGLFLLKGPQQLERAAVNGVVDLVFFCGVFVCFASDVLFIGLSSDLDPK